jgi:prolyl oligopeptidase
MTRRSLWALAVPIAAVSLLAAEPPPRTEVRPVTDVLHGVTFVDPYRWLEDQASPAVRRWIDEQNAYAERILDRSPERAALARTLRRLMDRPEVGPARRGGGFEYFTLRRSGEQQAAIYRRPMPATPGERIDPAGAYELVIDPRPLSTSLTSALDVVAVTPAGDRLIYGIRDGGQDEREIVVRDLKAQKDVERFPSALYDSVTLRVDGQGFYYVRRSRETGARVRSHDWGAPPAKDQVIFGDGYAPTAFVSMAASDDQQRVLFAVQHGWARSDVFLRDGAGRPQPVAVNVPAHFYPRFVKDELWMRTNLDAPMGRVVAVDAAAPADRSRWRTVLPERAEVLEDFTVIGDRVYGTYLRDTRNVILVFDRSGHHVGDIDVPDFTSASIRGDGDQAAVLTLESFTSPEATYRVDLASGSRTLQDAPWLSWDASRYAVERLVGTSKDGTQVPIYVFGRKDRPRDGRQPTLLFGYGGFTASQKPRFSAMAAAWVEGGGTYAMAVLRGGNEYGEAWHRAGMLTNKQNVFDDFIAAAEALIRAQVTRPESLAIMGTSNGGLLVGAALTQRPDLYRAVLCGFPDVDILRFNQYRTSNNMPALLEYGDASIPDQFAAIRRFSPYQNVRPSRYPAVMIWSGDLDTRVPPLAARKFTAALQAATTSGRPVILKYYEKAGHATNNGLPFSQRVDLAAAQLAFVRHELRAGGDGVGGS